MKNPGKFYLCPIMNTMGPVVDDRHDDLLPTWKDVDQGVEKIFDPEYRMRFPDSGGNGAKFSWFVISWSGFSSNPVQRDFGYFNIYDHYREKFGTRMDQCGDGIYWMYNHPPASGVGNEWGLDWFHNAQYLEILMRFVAERNWFPSVVQIPTENNETSNFLENYFPYDLSNRNAADVNWVAKNADGKSMAEVIDWRRATHNWNIYSPSMEDHQTPGSMKRKVGRLLDIQSVVYVFKEDEIEKAFQHCLEGCDAMVCGYEHDFRDRADVIMNRLIEPVSRIAADYPEVEWYYKNSLEAFNLLNDQIEQEISFSVSFDAHGNLIVDVNGEMFGQAPFTFFKNGDRYSYVNPLKVGKCKWLIYKTTIQNDSTLYVSGLSSSGIQRIDTFF